MAGRDGGTDLSTRSKRASDERPAHSESAASGSWEPLPSYLQRAGIDVIWRGNNWGEPPLKV